jgi:hypothetical protein
MTRPAITEPVPSVWEDLLEIFYAPKVVFERRRETPAFGIALVILVVLMVGLGFAMRGIMEPIFDVEFKRSMAQAMKDNPKLTEEQMMQGKEIAKKFLFIGVGFYALVTPMLLGILLWFVGKFVDSKAEVGQTMMVATYGFYPRIIEGVANAAQLLFLPDQAVDSRYSVSLGVGRFLDADTANPLLLAIVGRVDVFTLWVTALFVIGIAVVGRISYGRAVAVGVVMWLIGALPGVWGAFRAM